MQLFIIIYSIITIPLHSDINIYMNLLNTNFMYLSFAGNEKKAFKRTVVIF